MTVSATQEASPAATAASAAVPPASRISIPASAVAGWPAATAAGTIEAATLPGDRSLGRSRPSFAACWDCGDVYLEVELTLAKEVKLEIVGKHGRHDSDTGSPEVQIALLT